MENPEKADVRDPSCMTDDELRATLLAHGVKAGPIVGKTALNTVLKTCISFHYRNRILVVISTVCHLNYYSIVCLSQPPPGPCMRRSVGCFILMDITD